MTEFERTTDLTNLTGSRQELQTILNAIRETLIRYVAFPDEEASFVVAAWIMHTHLLDRFDCTPRLVVLSPTPGSGKSRLLQVVAHLSRDGVFLSSASSSSIFRTIDVEMKKGSGVPPTFLLDEGDTYLGTRAGQGDESLRRLIDSGYQRGAKISLNVSKNGDYSPQQFHTFAPIGIASLHRLAPSIMTRAIVITMLKRKPSQTVEVLRTRQVKENFDPLKQLARDWATNFQEELVPERVVMPSQVSDRNQDIWEPLICIGDFAGREWSSIIRQAAINASVETPRSEPSVRLLTDLKELFRTREKLSTADILKNLLASEDSYWHDFNGSPLTDVELSRILRPFGIRPKTIWVEGTSIKGYSKKDFLNIWERYVPE